MPLGGMAEIYGHATDLGEGRPATCERAVARSFPGGDVRSHLLLRPMNDSAGRNTGVRPDQDYGAFLNTGYLTLG